MLRFLTQMGSYLSVFVQLLLLQSQLLLNKKRYWVMSINDDGFPVFGKQIAIQLKHQKCTLSHWVMDDSLPAYSPILLRHCPVL
ncbi:uncharacterized protein OCT59_001940 [Rhizophagus irregularis]|uniref:uncharacterized protein n=1 Tax=Rhizophagus irregularis TaxID=588596 RepID=UPI0033224669|nr:hypothetical protein OCT59_001940 [Rhizophagus irregularis]